MTALETLASATTDLTTATTDLGASIDSAVSDILSQPANDTQILAAAQNVAAVTAMLVAQNGRLQVALGTLPPVPTP